MNPLSPIFAIVVYFIAFATAYLLNLTYKTEHYNTRYQSIDGMRGFLAIGVFIHHASIWFQYLQTESWDAPQSNLYNHLGQTSVSFFFMITAFLFITKLLNSDDKKNDWNILFISRFFRLVPMYIVSTLLLVLIIFIISDWVLKVSFTQFAKEMLKWGTFTVLGAPAINDSSFTRIINANVNWSLPYEWLFYFSLPVISILVYKKITSKIYLVVSLLFILIFYKIYGFNQHHMLSFLGGAIPAFLSTYNLTKINFNSTIFSLVILICLTLILLFDTPDNYICKLLIAIVFSLIASGNDFFGILRSTTLKFLGEISYSTYLIHGIIIFTAMYFYYTLGKAKYLSPVEFCTTIFIMTPIIVLISFLLYRNIEKPFIDYSKKLIKKLY